MLLPKLSKKLPRRTVNIVSEIWNKNESDFTDRKMPSVFRQPFHEVKNGLPVVAIET
jgi:hypothetical protein